MPAEPAGVFQTKKHDCGDAIVRTLLAHWGLKSSPRLATEFDGTDPRTVEALLRLGGLHVLAGNLHPAALKALTGLGHPVACLVRAADGDGHWVAAWKVSRGGVHYFDPRPGVGGRRDRLADFVARWRDVDRFGVRYHRFGVCGWLDES